MKVTTVKEFSKRKVSDCLIIPFFGNKYPKIACSCKIPEEWKIPIECLDFSGKEKQTVFVYAKDSKEKRILLLGLGKKEEISKESIRKSFASAVLQCKQKKIEKISIVFPSEIKEENVFSNILEGVYLSNYTYLKFKKNVHSLKSLEIIGVEKNLKLIKKNMILSSGVSLARDLVNGNADEITPEKLKEVAEEFKKISPKIKVSVFDKKRIEKEGMDLLLAVNKGSCTEPYFIMVDYKPDKLDDKTVLIGKGITYDTGGLCLKSPESMDTMKTDMSGAACVLGTIYVCAMLGLKKNITAIVPATENSIGSKSYKPGDVYFSYSKKSVEIVNTDAEGRLILADAISYAVKKLKPKRIIDIATLTGAVKIALGEEIAGVFSNSKDVWEKLKKSSENTGENIWRMPLFKEYKTSLRSEIADIKNIGGKAAGFITSALFLQEFVEDIQWAHIDIGGTSYYKKPKGYHPTPATGYGVRLLVDFLENL